MQPEQNTAEPFRADWSKNPSIEDMERELRERGKEMGDTEFYVKKGRLVNAGGTWPPVK